MGSLRIVGGRLGGRRLRAPTGDATRPTSDRVREAIASVLDARGAIEGARVLDLYAGSGALGFEMLSRGAEHAVFVERDPRVARLLRENAEELGLAAACEVRVEDATRTRAQRLLAEGPPFSLVLADPPYRDVQAAVEALSALHAHGSLASHACLLLEHGSKVAPVLPREFEAISSYRYGDTGVMLFAPSTTAISSTQDP